jgi:hypothetical protein
MHIAQAPRNSHSQINTHTSDEERSYLFFLEKHIWNSIGNEELSVCLGTYEIALLHFNLWNVMRQ